MQLRRRVTVVGDQLTGSMPAAAILSTSKIKLTIAFMPCMSPARDWHQLHAVQKPERKLTIMEDDYHKSLGANRRRTRGNM